MLCDRKVKSLQQIILYCFILSLWWISQNLNEAIEAFATRIDFILKSLLLAAQKLYLQKH